MVLSLVALMKLSMVSRRESRSGSGRFCISLVRAMYMLMQTS